MIVANLTNLDDMRDTFDELLEPGEVAALYDTYECGEEVELLEEETDNFYNIKLPIGITITGLSIDHLTDLRFRIL